MGGVTFSEISATAFPSVSQRKWTGVAMSADGTIRAAVCKSYYSGTAQKGRVCYYTATPVPSWSQYTTKKSFSSIAMSSDGFYAMAVSSDSNESSDYFTTWFTPGGTYSNSLCNFTVADYTQTTGRFVTAGLNSAESLGTLCYSDNATLPHVDIFHDITDQNFATFKPFSTAISWYNTAYFTGQLDDSLRTFKTYYSTNYTISNGIPNWNETLTNIPIRGISSSRTFLASDFLAAVGSYEFLRIGSNDNWTEQQGSGSHDWVDISIASDNDSIIYAAATCRAGSESYAAETNRNDFIYKSIDGGNNWTKCSQFGRKVWKSVSVNSDGTIVAAASAPDGMGDDGAIYVSTNGGTPSKYQDNNSYKNIRISDDGKIIVSSYYGNNCIIGKYPYSISDWLRCDSVSESKQAVISGDGQKYALLYQTQVFVFNTNGGTLLDKNLSETFNTICMTKDSKSVIIAGTGKLIRYNLNTEGTSYIESSINLTNSSAKIVCSDISRDGRIVVLGEEYGSIYISYDGGTNFVELFEGSSNGTRKRNWTSVALSSDGFTVFATVKNQRGIVRLR